MAVLGFGVSALNSGLSAIQYLAMQKRIENTSLTGPPIFIVGHWRSGTTLMHELLTLDQQFAFPNNFDAFSPNHLLVSRPVLQPLINLLLPGKRPMDAMAMDAASPQEDDFALISLGAPTLYRKIAFPNDRFSAAPGDSPESDQGDENTRRAMIYFLKILTARYQKQLVLKSPPHTARIQQLSSWFPDARFIHLSRHPFQVVPSTVKLWRALDWTQGFQIPRYTDDELLDYIHQEQTWMYDAYEAQTPSIPENRLLEIRFEDLIADPLGQTEQVYQKFDLPGFADASRKIRDYMQSTQSVRPSKGTEDQHLRERILGQWEAYMHRFRYDENPAGQTTLTSIKS